MHCQCGEPPRFDCWRPLSPNRPEVCAAILTRSSGAVSVRETTLPVPPATRNSAAGTPFGGGIGGARSEPQSMPTAAPHAPATCQQAKAWKEELERRDEAGSSNNVEQRLLELGQKLLKKHPILKQKLKLGSGEGGREKASMKYIREHCRYRTRPCCKVLHCGSAGAMRGAGGAGAGSASAGAGVGAGVGAGAGAGAGVHGTHIGTRGGPHRGWCGAGRARAA